MPKKVTFIILGSGHSPIGGIKMIYEYANGLTTRGYEVMIVHVAMHPFGSFFDRWGRFLVFLGYGLSKKYLPTKWFVLDPRIKILWMPRLHLQLFRYTGVLILTSWKIVQWAEDRKLIDKDRQIYFIQDIELDGDLGIILKTWKLPILKIVINQSLQEIAESLGQKAHYIPNGFNFSSWGVDRPIEKRDPYRVMMLYSNSFHKNIPMALKVLSSLKEDFPLLTVALFGSPRRLLKLPSWIHYYRVVHETVLRKLYNEAAIFIAPSNQEGWDLPASEALICGCALVATDIRGHREYAFHEKTALLSPPEDTLSMEGNIRRLFKDDLLRKRLSQKGGEYIQRFTMGKSLDIWDALLAGLVGSEKQK